MRRSCCTGTPAIPGGAGDKENRTPARTIDDGDCDEFSTTAAKMMSILAPFFRIMTINNKMMDEAIGDNLFESLRVCAIKGSDHGETVKSISAKIHSRVTSSDRKTRDKTLERLVRKNSHALEIVVDTLESCKDFGACCNLLSILRICLSPKIPKLKSKAPLRGKTARKTSSKLVITQLVNFNCVQVLIQILINVPQSEVPIADQMAQEAIWILGQLVQKDSRFVFKVKSLNAARTFHSLFKYYYNQNKILMPMLQIIKSLSKNASMVQTLVKDGLITTLEKIFIYLGYTPRMKLRILMECFKHITSSRICCVKFVKVGLVHMLMKIFERWERFDGDLRLRISNNALNTLQHVCMIKAGKKAIKSNNGLQLLYRFCVSCPEEKIYDCLLSRICGIINQCLEKTELSVPEVSPAQFPLTGLDTSRKTSEESNSDAEGGAIESESANRSYSDMESEEDDDSYNNNTSDSMDRKKSRKNSQQDASKYLSVIDFERTENDLKMYNIFFREITVQHDSDLKPKIRVRQKSYSMRSRSDSTNLRSPNTLRLFSSLNQVSSCEEERYCTIASRVRSILPFAKVAYPDMIGAQGSGRFEPLNNKDRRVCRTKLLACVDRGLHASGVALQQTVYDLDALIHNDTRANIPGDTRLSNADETNRWKRIPGNQKSLHFESRFESGNLRKVIQIAPREYELILTPDVNSASRHQWFYFEVSNMEPGVLYTFNIVNCEKANSQFNFGMKPIMFSVAESLRGRSGWVRTGIDVCYYRNCYRRPGRQGNYLTTSFSLNFPHANDVCYLAYHFPYTYSHLMASIWKWTKEYDPTQMYFRVDNLCDSLNGNEIPLLTVTSPDSLKNPINERKIIFLTSRVHPGESNASWVMHGTLEGLLSNTAYAASLRDDYIFKIVPMLNNEGVINGCNRFGLTNEDLNRRWSSPNPTLHPAIYHTKGLMEFCSRVLRRPPFVFVDYHGHSRRKNVFLFGCSNAGSWSAADRSRPDDPQQYLMLPHLMQSTSPAFALPLCSFKVERHKEATARVAIWRQLGVARSYTMESSFCGCDQGPLSGFHLDTKHLREIGEDFCKALALMKSEPGDLKMLEKISIDHSFDEEDGNAHDDDMSSSCDSEDSD